MGQAMADMTPPVVGDVGGRRAMREPIHGGGHLFGHIEHSDAPVTR